MDVGRGRDNFFTSVWKVVRDRPYIFIWRTASADTMARMVGFYSGGSVFFAPGAKLDVDVQNTCMSTMS